MTLDSAIGVISRWSSTTNNKFHVFNGNRNEINQYLQSIDEIQISIASGTAYDRSRANSAIQIAMLRLSDEMRNILKVNGKSTRKPESITYSSTMTDSASNTFEDDYVYGNVLSEKVIDDLRSIAVRMNSAGYLRQLKTTYISERKLRIEASYQKLKIQKLNSSSARTTEWKDLESIIKIWIKSTKICFRKIFAYEKQLCENIFSDLGDDIIVACFLETVNDFANQLLDIAKSLSCIRKESKRIFRILELYKTFSDLLPEINKLFDTQSSHSIRTKSNQILEDLATAARKCLENFEKELLTGDLFRHNEMQNVLKYVMDYVFKLSQNKQIIMSLSLCNPPLTPGARMEFEIVEELPNKLPFHVIWIVMCLVSNLESKSKSYENASDVNFFLMNNFYYIIQKINGKSEVKELIGDYYFENISNKLDQVKNEYLKLTFAKVLRILEGNKSLPEKLKRFNGEFSKLQIKLSALSVTDFQLLKELRASMEEMLVPKYALFYDELCSSPLLLRDVKFSVEKLKTAMLDFFTNTQKIGPNKRYKKN